MSESTETRLAEAEGYLAEVKAMARNALGTNGSRLLSPASVLRAVGEEPWPDAGDLLKPRPLDASDG
jgi:hypothetical protein